VSDTEAMRWMETLYGRDRAGAHRAPASVPWNGISPVRTDHEARARTISFFSKPILLIDSPVLTSQFFANIYLDALDHFVKERLRIGRYLRYVDDFC